MEDIEIIWKPMFKKNYLQERSQKIIFLSQKVDGMGGDTWYRGD